jgi:hypothetical protein
MSEAMTIIVASTSCVVTIISAIITISASKKSHQFL